MKIKFTESRINNNLGFGILMIGVGLFAIYQDSFSVFGYLWILFGGLQIGTALYEKKNQYLTIGCEKLIKHSLVPKTIEIKDITKVRKFTNSYEIETPGRKITIDKGIIEPDSLFRLEDFFNSLKLKF